jgi:hypothetical protein
MVTGKDKFRACGQACFPGDSRLAMRMAASFFTRMRVLRLAMFALAAACLSQCATQKVSDEGSYTLGEKEGEDPLSLHGEMEVSVGYATGDFPDARRAMGGPARW